ncbi:A/G-specific adenine glycosylase [Neisseriaceae bacterium B1]
MNPSFSNRLITWQKQHGRHNLPWQVSDPYRVWLSEIMLQQTQVATVLDYYPRFLAAFPDVQRLAAAPQDEVLSLWAGLGYYSRARLLHKAAQQIVQQFGGQLPSQRLELEKLSGVGRSTAAAIAAFAFRQPETILDGNVKRVLCRVFALDGNPADKKFEQQLWQLAESLLPENRNDMPAYTQGLMDLGATVCKRSKPLCDICPMSDICQAKAQNKIDELPRKKTPIAVKNIALYWLILRRHDGAIWLEKRPQTGIWAGLYCVPTFESWAQLNDFAAQCGLLSEDLAEQTAFTHRLTHRLLEITPYECVLARNSVFRQPENHTGAWYTPAKIQSLGLPKPLFSYSKN